MGESRDAASAAGERVIVVQGTAIIVGGAFAGLASASQFMFQAMDVRIPYQFFLMLPYLLTILALAGAVGHVTAPRELGR